MRVSPKLTHSDSADRAAKGIVVIALFSIIGVYIGHYINLGLQYEGVGVIGFTTAMSTLTAAIYVIKRLEKTWR